MHRGHVEAKGNEDTSSQWQKCNFRGNEQYLRRGEELFFAGAKFDSEEKASGSSRLAGRTDLASLKN